MNALMFLLRRERTPRGFVLPGLLKIGAARNPSLLA